MRRRVYGEDGFGTVAISKRAPLDLSDLSYGPSWLSFAQASGRSNAYAAAALRGEAKKEKPRNLYTGKTYNSTEAIAEFFKKRESAKKDVAVSHNAETGDDTGEHLDRLTGYGKLKALASREKREDDKPPVSAGGAFVPGSHVRHEKYGRGLVLRREGSGNNVKLTISFPGFGQKKMMEKYANLQNA